jgi:hypothetical protein
MAIHQDENGWTHIDWELEGVTAKMIDWWWCNMEKGFPLWHPIDHTDFYWHVRPTPERILGAIHVAPQVWSDGTWIKPHIRYDDVASLPEEIQNIIILDHVAVVAGISMTGENFNDDDPPLAYRIHQWAATDAGVRGISSAVPIEPEPLERGLVWAKHGAEEIGYFQQFLAELYKLWRVVKNPMLNPYYSFKIEKDGNSIRYVSLPVVPGNA